MLPSRSQNPPKAHSSTPKTKAIKTTSLSIDWLLRRRSARRTSRGGLARGRGRAGLRGRAGRRGRAGVGGGGAGGAGVGRGTWRRAGGAGGHQGRERGRGGQRP